MSKKRSPGFLEKNRGVTPSVAAPGVTHPSDANASRICIDITNSVSDAFLDKQPMHVWC